MHKKKREASQRNFIPSESFIDNLLHLLGNFLKEPLKPGFLLLLGPGTNVILGAEGVFVGVGVTSTELGVVVLGGVVVLELGDGGSGGGSSGRHCCCSGRDSKLKLSMWKWYETVMEGRLEAGAMSQFI
jgi:hypothetical protein